MNSFKNMIILVVLMTGLMTAGQVNAAGIGNNIVVLGTGTGTAYAGNDLFNAFGLDPLDALCFDMDLVDAKTGNVIGTATDCLSGITPSSTDSGLMLTTTTFFVFPGGNLVSRGLVTVQPVLHGTPESTHITSAAPSPGGNSVVYGDGKFSNAAGSVRLSGAVNMSKLNSHGQITFDCVFIIDV